MHLIYDVSHNMCKFETHLVNGVKKRLLIHRKVFSFSFFSFFLSSSFPFFLSSSPITHLRVPTGVHRRPSPDVPAVSPSVPRRRGAGGRRRVDGDTLARPGGDGGRRGRHRVDTHSHCTTRGGVVMTFSV